MGWRKHILVLGLFLVLLGSVAGVLAVLLRHEPGFYRRSRITPGPEREELARAFIAKATTLGGNILEGTSKEWWVTIAESQINSYLQEVFPNEPDAKLLEKYGITEPRVVIDQDKIRLAFRYGQPPWSTVVSVDFRVWLASKELNVFALQVINRRAGAMPVSSQSLLETIKVFARHNQLDLDWYRHEGNPVAVLRIRGSHTKTQFNRLELRPGLLTIGGLPLPTIGVGN